MNLTKLTDKELVRLVQTGNGYKERAYTEIVQRYTQQLGSFIFNMLGNDEEAKDQVQETFLKMWKHIGSYNEQSAQFTTWIHTIAKNQAFNILRNRKIKRFEDIQEFSGLEQTTFPSPDRAIECQKAERKIRLYIDNLPYRYREVLVLRIDGRSYEDIASILNLPLGTTKSRVNRAKQLFRKNYELAMQK
jgi:RNA polymerase sigma-70 factor (ECF subfamily)